MEDNKVVHNHQLTAWMKYGELGSFLEPFSKYDEEGAVTIIEGPHKGTGRKGKFALFTTGAHSEPISRSVAHWYMWKEEQDKIREEERICRLTGTQMK